MPIYEYACGGCRSTFELLIRGAETPVCPQCQSDKLEKLLSVPAAPSSSGTSSTANSLPTLPPPCGMGGCGRPECD